MSPISAEEDSSSTSDVTLSDSELGIHRGIELCKDCSTVICVDCDVMHCEHKRKKLPWRTKITDIEIGEPYTGYPDTAFIFDSIRKSVIWCDTCSVYICRRTNVWHTDHDPMYILTMIEKKLRFFSLDLRFLKMRAEKLRMNVKDSFPNLDSHPQLAIFASFTRQLLKKLKDFDFLQSEGSLKFEIDETIAHIYNLKCMLELSDEDCLRAFLELQNRLDVYLEEKRALSSQGIHKHDVSRWSHDLSALMGSCVDFAVKASQTPASDILPIHRVQGSRIVSDFEFGIDQSRDIILHVSESGGKVTSFDSFRKSSTVLNRDPNSALFYAYRYKFGPEDVGRIKRFHNLLAVPKGNCIVVYRIEESNFIEVTSFSVPNHYARFLYMQVFHDDVDLRPRYLFTFWTMRKPGMGPHLARFDDQGTCIDTAECEDPPYLFQLDQDVAIYTYTYTPPYVGIVDFSKKLQMKIKCDNGLTVDDACNLRNWDSVSHRIIFFDHQKNLALIGRYWLETTISQKWEPLSIVNFYRRGVTGSFSYMTYWNGRFYAFKKTAVFIFDLRNQADLPSVEELFGHCA